MIVVMKKDASDEEVRNIVERVESLGLKSHVIVGTERTVIAAIGENANRPRSRCLAVLVLRTWCQSWLLIKLLVVK